jgi:hypothetical protein
MKYFLLLPAFFLNLQLFAQEEVEEVITDEPKDQTINVECNCPPSEVQAEEATPELNSIFPTGSVFLLSPAPTPAAPIQKEEEKKEQIPGYIENLQRGYSDDSYKQIIRE